MGTTLRILSNPAAMVPRRRVARIYISVAPYRADSNGGLMAPVGQMEATGHQADRTLRPRVRFKRLFVYRASGSREEIYGQLDGKQSRGRSQSRLLKFHLYFRAPFTCEPRPGDRSARASARDLSSRRK